MKLKYRLRNPRKGVQKPKPHLQQPLDAQLVRQYH